MTLKNFEKTCGIFPFMGNEFQPHINIEHRLEFTNFSKLNLACLIRVVVI